MSAWQSRYGGIEWRTTPDGVETRTDGVLRSRPAGSAPVTIRRYWFAFRDELRAAAAATGVPLELLLMTIATESGARWDPVRLDWTYPAVRLEPGYVSDESTPHRISVGPCHLLLSTARTVLGRPRLTRAELQDRAVNLLAAARYIRDQRHLTGYDPILVAAAYNSGGIHDASRTTRPEFKNRWHLRSWGSHLERAAAWYGDACAVLREPVPTMVG